MKKTGFFSIVLLALISTSAFAKSSGEIVTGGTNAALKFAQDYKDDYKARFAASLGYDHVFKEGFAFGGSAEFTIGSGYGAYAFKVGPSYNFQPSDLENSYYLGIKAGILIEDYGYSYTNAIATIEGGKRFKIAEGISYSPSLEITKIFGPGEPDPSFTFNIFKFSLIF